MNMRVATVIAAVLMGFCAADRSEAQFTTGNLVVLRVGDGTSTLVNTGNSFSLVEFNTAGSNVQSVNIISTGASGLQLSGTATSEGILSLSPDGRTLSFAGYNPGASGFTGSGSLANRTSTQAPRAFGSVSVSTESYTFGNVFSGTSANFTGNNVRGAVVTDAGGAYGFGASNGVLYNSGTGSSTPVSTNISNIRVTNIINGDTYLSTTTSGVEGIYKISGTPTTGTNNATALITTGVAGLGTNPNGFALSPGSLTVGSIAYIADGVLGVQKFVYDGTSWVLQYNITSAQSGLTDLSVDFSGSSPVLYAVSPDNLYKYTDTGAGAFTSIATAGSNFAFRGVELLVPVPEPATVLGLSVLGLGVFAGVRRRFRKSEPTTAA